MTSVQFAKGHGTGNDFVLLPDPDGELELAPDDVVRLCDRRFGIGGDGVLRVVRTERAASASEVDIQALPGAPTWFMDYRNADGSVAQMCGNGIRVFARYLRQHGWIPAGRCEIATRGGIRVVDVSDSGDITVDMGPAGTGGFPAEVPVTLDGREYLGRPLLMPNPHAVVMVESLAALPADLSTRSVPGEVFPDGVNVEFVEILSPRSVRMRVVERGVGETMSCGTGACAVAVAVADHNGIQPGEEIEVAVPGGQLVITVTAAGSVLMRGPAEIVAEGHLNPSWWSGQ